MSSHVNLYALWLAASLILGTTAQARRQRPRTARAQCKTHPPPRHHPHHRSAFRSDDPPSAPSSEYEVALSEALEAHARGDYGQARIFMERAHSLDPSARTLRGLGIVAFAQGRHPEAIRFLDASLASHVKPLPPELTSGVVELLTHAWGQVGRYEFWSRVATFYRPSNARFLRPEHRHTHAGPSHLHRARGQRADHDMTLEVKPGERRTLQIVLARPPAPQVVERFVAHPSTATDDSPRSGPSASAESPG